MRKSAFRMMLLALALVALAGGAKAQKNGLQDAVHLHNGSIIRGELQTSTDGSIRVKTMDGSLWVFKADEVKEVTQEDYYALKRTLVISKKGFYNASSAGLMVGRSENFTELTASITTVCGYKINPHYSIGIGVGIESFEPGLAPIFLEGRYNLLESKFTPFVGLQGGYSIPIDNYRAEGGEWQERGGVMGNAEIGVINYIGHNAAITFSVGYRYQQSVSRQDYWWFQDDDFGVIRDEFHRFAFRAGLLFN